MYEGIENDIDEFLEFRELYIKEHNMQVIRTYEMVLIWRGHKNSMKEKDDLIAKQAAEIEALKANISCL